MHYLFTPKRIKLTFTERLFAVAVLSVTLHLSFPQYSHAAVPIDAPARTNLSDVFAIAFSPIPDVTIEAAPTPLVVTNDFVEREIVKQNPKRVVWVTVTAYSSEERQTDGSPYITAKNTFVRNGIIAANFLPFNTRVRMPQYFGDKEFVVEDRMNERYFERIDIWMSDTEAAKAWGARRVKIEVL